MLLSFNWLKQHIKLPDLVTAEQVAEKLKLSTVEVEKVERQGAQLENIVVGKVLTSEPHPNADKLKVCEVDIGDERVSVVCGGSNVRAGLLTALAKVGAKVRWHGQGERVELKPVKIRGVESAGMICASDEIGLLEMFPKKQENEILDLGDLTRPHPALPLKGEGVSVPPPFKEGEGGGLVGQSLAVVLGLNDAILEIDNKSLSNRPDLWGHYGFSREVAALFGRAVEPYQAPAIKPGKAIKLAAEIKVPKACPRYMAVAVDGVKIAPSPPWLKNYLTAAGVRPINNIVDITNYVMLDLAQPTHAFDARLLSGDRAPRKKINIVVRAAGAGERFTTLDGRERALNAEMFVIADTEKAIALGGLMGGANTEIKPDTAMVLFESANFNAVTVRQTSQALGLRTEGSLRWEKSQDPTQAEAGLNKLVALTLELCPGARVVSNVVDIKNFKLFTGPLEIPVALFEKLLGVAIPPKTIIATLERLGFKVEAKKHSLKITIPTWRATKDISIPEDIVEEVGRMWGYDNVPAALPTWPITPPEPNRLLALERVAADTLARELGYAEVYNYSFVSAAQIAKFGDDPARHLELDNPLSKEKPYLRYQLIMSLVENVARNIDSFPQLKLFEIGKVFHADQAGPRVSEKSDELLPRQDVWLTAVYADKQNQAPWWQARRAAEALGQSLGLVWEFGAPDNTKPWRHPARAAQLTLNKEPLGFVYELHPAVTENFGLKARAGVLALNLSRLAELQPTALPGRFLPIPLYPEVVRDVAFTVKRDLTHATLSAALQSADPLVKKVELFDVFDGPGVPEGHKSMAYHTTYRHPERTLTSEEVDRVQTKTEQLLVKKFGAEIRG